MSPASVQSFLVLLIGFSVAGSLATGYQLVNGELKNQDWVAPTINTTADGALYLSLEDYIAWDRGLRTVSLLNPES